VSDLVTDMRGAAYGHLVTAAMGAVLLMYLAAAGYGNPLAIAIGGAMGLIVAAQRSAAAEWLAPSTFRELGRATPVVRHRSPRVVRRAAAAIVLTLFGLALAAWSSAQPVNALSATVSLALAAVYASAGLWGLEELQVLLVSPRRPPAPRPRAALALALLLLAVALTAVSYLGWTLWQWHELDSRGVAVVAAVRSTDATGLYQASYVVRLAFDADGAHVDDLRCVTRETYLLAQRERRVDVRYLPDNPRIYRIGADEGCLTPSLLLIFATVFVAMAGGVLTIPGRAR